MIINLDFCNNFNQLFINFCKHLVLFSLYFGYLRFPISFGILYQLTENSHGMFIK